MTWPPESFALQLRLHRKGVAPIQDISIWQMVMQRDVADASHAIHLDNSQRANVLFDNSLCLTRIRRQA